MIKNPYPAVGAFSFLGAIIKVPGSYHRSVAAGESWLTDELVGLAHCGRSTSVVLTGYSQGAQVTADVVRAISPPHVLGVALFGDPYFNSHDSVDRGGFQVGRNGFLGKRRGFSPYWRAHVLSYCHVHDPVCQGPLHNVGYGFSRHKTYGKLGEPEQAAWYFKGLESYRLDINLSTNSVSRRVSINQMPLTYGGHEFFMHENPIPVLGPPGCSVGPGVINPDVLWSWNGPLFFDGNFATFASLDLEADTTECTAYASPIIQFVIGGAGAVVTPVGSLWVRERYADVPAAIRATLVSGTDENFFSKRCSSSFPGSNFDNASTFGLDLITRHRRIEQINAGPC